MSVRTYNPSVRVGNWNEDLCLEEEQLKDFLEKKDKGELTVQKKTNFLKTILRPVELSKSSDGYLHIGDRVCLLHTPTKSIISAHVKSARAFDATRLENGCEVTCSRQLAPCPRNVFVITSYDDSETAREGDVVCYGQPIALVTLPEEGGQLGLHSDRATFIKHSKFSREQEVLLQEEITYNSAWKFLCFYQDQRLETEGSPVPANTTLFINHCKTNQNLAVHEEWTYKDMYSYIKAASIVQFWRQSKTAFGRELEVTGQTRFNTHKTEDIHNHFMVVCGSLEDVVTSLSPTSPPTSS